MSWSVLNPAGWAFVAFCASGGSAVCDLSQMCGNRTLINIFVRLVETFTYTGQSVCLVNTLYLFIYLFLINLFMYLVFLNFWLRWVFVAARGLSLVVGSGGYSSLRCAGFSLPWLLLLQNKGAQASVVAARRLSSCGARA